jgi:hypothetical protein
MRRPPPRGSERVRSPPASSTVRAAIASPSPDPSTLLCPGLRQNRSVARSSSSGGTPGPVSRTAISTTSGSAATVTVTEPPDGVNFTALSSTASSRVSMAPAVAVTRRPCGPSRRSRSPE